MRRLVLLLCLAAALLAPAAAAASPRLDRLAAELREGPLAVDPDVAFLLSADERRALSRDLADARAPFHVALLPALEEDESGGDQARQLRGLRDRLREPGVYVVVDQEGTMDIADDRVPFRLQVAYGTLAGELDSREQTVPERLRQLVADAAAAPAGAPAGYDPVSTEDPLPALRERETVALAPRVALGVVGGLLAGLALFVLTRVGAAMLRGSRA